MGPGPGSFLGTRRVSGLSDGTDSLYYYPAGIFAIYTNLQFDALYQRTYSGYSKTGIAGDWRLSLDLTDLPL
ncbi:MAG: hypothetical protein U1F00_24595 [Rhodoferax sp.]